MTDKQTSAPRGVSRRAVAKGVAWATPAVLVAGAAPATAATPLPPVVFTGRGCKNPFGGRGSRYFFEITVSADVGASSASITGIDWDQSPGVMNHLGQKIGSGTPTFVPGTITFPAGGGAVVLKFNNPNNAANGKLTITYNIASGPNAGTHTTSVRGEFNSSCPAGITNDW